MGSVIQDIHRDFGEVGEKFDSLDTILPLLKDLTKQKETVNGGYFVENSNHGHGHFDVHFSNFEDGVSAEFKKALYKVELPKFDGNDLVRWIAKPEKGEGLFGLHWYGRSCCSLVQVFEEETTTYDLRRFSTGGIENPYEQLAGLRQTGWVEKFVQQIEMLLAQIDEVPEELALGFFMNGLNGVIISKVRTHDPQTVTKAIRLAMRVRNEIYGESMGFVSKNNSKGLFLEW
ncbi:hypothetical protein CR513_33763, partial [Mucuna pruriens]